MIRLLFWLAGSCALVAQYPQVLLDSAGHPAKVYNSAPTFPDLSSFTWVQQESAVLTQNTLAPPVIQFSNSGNKHEHMLLRSLPAAPYTVLFGVSITQGDYTKAVSATLVLRNSVADTAFIYAVENEQAVKGVPLCCRLIAGGHLSQTVGVDADSVLTSPFFYANRFPAQRDWLKIVDDGTNRFYYSSSDEKHTWTLDLQELSSSLTANQVGIAGYSLEAASFSYYLTVWEFVVSTP